MQILLLPLAVPTARIAFTYRCVYSILNIPDGFSVGDIAIIPSTRFAETPSHLLPYDVEHSALPASIHPVV